MKYLFLDSFASFSPCILAGALMDITKNKDALKKLCAPLFDAEIFAWEEKRCGMEALFAQLAYDIQKNEINCDYLFSVCKKLDVSEKVRGSLDKYVKTITEAKSINPEDALFDAKKSVDDLIFTAYSLETLKDLKAEKIWVSKVLLSSPDVCSPKQSEKIFNAMYILKKHNISPTLLPIDAPFLSEEGAALLSVLDASLKGSVSGSIIKTGYGAGKEDIKEMPNILRAVYGEEGEFDLLTEAEMQIDNLFLNTVEA